MKRFVFLGILCAASFNLNAERHIHQYRSDYYSSHPDLYKESQKFDDAEEHGSTSDDSENIKNETYSAYTGENYESSGSFFESNTNSLRNQKASDLYDLNTNPYAYPPIPEPENSYTNPFPYTPQNLPSDQSGSYYYNNASQDQIGQTTSTFQNYSSPSTQQPNLYDIKRNRAIDQRSDLRPPQSYDSLYDRYRLNNPIYRNPSTTNPYSPGSSNSNPSLDYQNQTSYTGQRASSSSSTPYGETINTGSGSFQDTYDSANKYSRDPLSIEQQSKPSSSFYPQTQDSDDSRLSHHLHDHMGDYPNVTVSVRNGVVTLRGRVNSQQEKTDLERDIKRIAGVKGVNNTLIIQN